MKKEKNAKGLSTLQLKNEQDIAYDFAVRRTSFSGR